MTVRVGCSGFSYSEWKGSFYPKPFANKKMLAYYAERLETVEVNNTFYRMPNSEVLTGWRTQVPASFQFAVKATRRITHYRRLKDCVDVLTDFLASVRTLGDALGPILFQCPPNMKCDTGVLSAFLATLPRDISAVFEFRHDSWDSVDVDDLLEEHGTSRVWVDHKGEAPPRSLPQNTRYLRLRGVAYNAETLAQWADACAGLKASDVFVFFKHENEGTAPVLASELCAILKEKTSKS